MGLVLSLIGVVAFVVGVIVSILEEVALRHAVLDGRGALDSIKATWADLKAKRGVASMWLVMILVNIAAGIAAAILFIPVVVVIGLVVAASVVAGGTGMFWLIVPALLVLFADGHAVQGGVRHVPEHGMDVVLRSHAASRAVRCGPRRLAWVPQLSSRRSACPRRRAGGSSSTM